MAETVEAYIANRVPPHHHALVERLRALLRECAPEAREAVRYRMICWTQRQILVYLTSREQDVTLGFVNGTQLDDPFGLLKGRGRGTRHVKMKDAAAVPDAALRHYIAQALKLDQTKEDAS